MYRCRRRVTMPVMVEPGPSVSVLPMPANRIAAKPAPPLMLPALKTDEPPAKARIP